MMKKKKTQKTVSVISSLAIVSTLSSSALASTLEVRSIYGKDIVPAYVRIKDVNNNPVKFYSTEKGYIQSNSGTDLLSSNMTNDLIYIQSINEGVYQVEGVSLDKKYALPNVQTISITKDSNLQTTLNLYDNIGSLSIRVVDNNNNPISGSSFEIEGVLLSKTSNGYTYSKNGSQNLAVSDSNGNIKIYNLPVGTYKVYQKSMNGYSNFANTSVSVDFNQMSTITVINKKDGQHSGSTNTNTANNNSRQNVQPNINTIRSQNLSKGILKLSVMDQHLLSGSKFSLKKGTETVKFKKNGNNYEASSSGNVSSIDTNTNSPVSIVLDPATYKLIENEAPKGYSKIKNRDVEIKKGIETKVEIKKKKEKGKLGITVKDESGIGMKGYSFSLTMGNETMKFKKTNDFYTYDKSGEFTEIETDDNGGLRIADLPVGEVSVKNTKSTEGYELLKEVQKKVIEKGNEVKLDIKAVKKKNIITIKNNGQPVSEVEYELYKQDKLFLSDKTSINGNIGPVNEDGDYYVKIIKVPERYVKTDKQIKFVLKNGEFNNQDLEIETAKIEASVGKKIAGEEFTLYKDGNKLSVESTNEEGIATFKELPYGNYSIKQTNSSSTPSKKEYNVVIDENYQNTKPYDFSQENAVPIKSKKKIDPIVAVIASLTALLLGYTGYNIYMLKKSKKLNKEDLKRFLKNPLSLTTKEKIGDTKLSEEEQINNEKEKLRNAFNKDDIVIIDVESSEMVEGEPTQDDGPVEESKDEENK